MNIWNELSDYAFEYYKWFRYEENISETELSVFSVNSNMIFSIEDKRDFFKTCTEVILKIFSNSNRLEKHQFFLFAIKFKFKKLFI